MPDGGLVPENVIVWLPVRSVLIRTIERFAPFSKQKAYKYGTFLSAGIPGGKVEPLEGFPAKL